MRLTKDRAFEELRETLYGKLSFLLIVGVEGAVRERALAEGARRNAHA